MLTRPAVVLLGAVLLSGCASGGVEGSSAAGATATPAASASSPATPVPTATAAAGPTPSDATTPSAPAVRTVSVTYAGGEVAGTSGREEVSLGEQVVLRFTSDVAEEIHVHGYDLVTDLPAGTPVDLALTADVPGVFEVELHDSGKVLYQLRVS